MTNEPTIVLFHKITDAESATIRKYLVDSGLMTRTQFRNVDRSDEAQKDLSSLVGSIIVPTLQVGTQIISGEKACLDFLKTQK